MKRASYVAEIRAAEMRVAQSGHDARDGLLRARAVLGAKLARPSVLALAAGAGGLLGFLLIRRPHPPAGSSSSGARVAGTTSTAGLLAAIIRRYALQSLPAVFRRVRLTAARSLAAVKERRGGVPSRQSQD